MRSGWIGPATSNARNASEDDKMNRSSWDDGAGMVKAFYPAIHHQLLMDQPTPARRRTLNTSSSRSGSSALAGSTVTAIVSPKAFKTSIE